MPRKATPARRSGKVEGKRYPLNMRTTFEVRQSLERAAKDSGRSLAQEAEHRMRHSFDADDHLTAAFRLAYGDRAAALAMIIARALHEAGTNAATLTSPSPVSAAEWLDDPYAFDQARQAVASVLESAAPTKSAAVPTKSSQPGHGLEIDQRTKSTIGTETAFGILAAACGVGRQSLAPWGAEIGKMLGPIKDRIIARSRASGGRQ